MHPAVELAEVVVRGLARFAALRSIPRQQRDLEARLARRLREVFGASMREALLELERLGRTPSGSADRTRIVEPLRRRLDDMSEAVADESVQAAQYGRNRTLNDLGKPISPLPDPTVRLLRERAFVASERTLNRMVGDVMDRLARSAGEGLGIDDIASDLEEVFTGMRDYELRRVARTEVNRSQQEGTHETEIELGVEYHQWLSADDGRQRDSHDFLDGQIVRVGDPFSNGLVRPGDTSAVDLSEVINCRCRLGPYLIPEGMRAPTGLAYFYPEDLVAVSV